ncbi:hypothetical protein B0H19DRAFT_1151900 [Mycena capillaripes]|nr:hypothetical protein B0H19DRAFT_1151900 [Mycena capillaripes]
MYSAHHDCRVARLSPVLPTCTTPRFLCSYTVSLSRRERVAPSRLPSRLPPGTAELPSFPPDLHHSHGDPPLPASAAHPCNSGLPTPLPNALYPALMTTAWHGILLSHARIPFRIFMDKLASFLFIPAPTTSMQTRICCPLGMLLPRRTIRNAGIYLNTMRGSSSSWRTSESS